MGGFWCVTLFVWPHYNSERRILPDVLNLQLDQRKFIVSEQFIEVGLITNNDGGGGECIVYAEEHSDGQHEHDWLDSFCGVPSLFLAFTPHNNG